MQNLLLFPKPQNIRLSVFPGKSSLDDFQDDRERSFRCWKFVWDDVFNKEMKLKKNLFSDEFSRQDLVVSLFHQNNCVGLAMIRIVPLNSEMTYEDSFFRFWTPKSLKKVSDLCAGNSSLALASAFTIHPEFRRKREGLDWKSLLLALYLETFLTTDAQILITAARKNRSNEKLCQNFGARLIEEDIAYTQDGSLVQGEIADLLYWPRDPSLDLGSEDLNDLKNSIWVNRTDAFKGKGVIYAA